MMIIGMTLAGWKCQSEGGSGNVGFCDCDEHQGVTVLTQTLLSGVTKRIYTRC